MLRYLVVAVASVILVSGCASYPAAPRVTLPPTGASFDYQLGGSYPAPDGAAIVERDSTSKPAKGSYGICYVNGFQSQPGVTWPKELLVHRSSGTLLVDPGWPDEHLFDISTAAKRAAIADRLGASIRRCARVGFQAVEFDNLDSYTRSKGALTKKDAAAFATLLVTRSHSAGLAVAQKNAAELTSRSKPIGFDFAMTEECDRYRECATFTKAYGDRVFDIEYVGELRGSAASVCARSTVATIIRDRDLVARGKSGYFYRAC
ncbi:endo alpha-1,4 polygalactosaminidase [soil metagenome]